MTFNFVREREHGLTRNQNDLWHGINSFKKDKYFKWTEIYGGKNGLKSSMKTYLYSRISIEANKGYFYRPPIKKGFVQS